MGRPRKPIEQLDPASVAHNRGRILKRLEGPKPVGDVGYVPKYFNAQEKAIWHELLQQTPVQLGRNDRCLLEITVTLMAKLRKRELENSQFPHLMNCLKQLGMITPERKPVEKEKAADPFDRFNTPK